ncbi:alpha-amylase family glycosyl hydrolase [Deinococcus sp. KSM4-11]|uniref:alpha-amylase family glycosyl hydrolase n=1 Tax=Deinococcus sp. KSM4-11 TaxID=2568654 RepID=UPI001454BC0E|nr:alpha-amylase family glycosyl hydrolase [Deinococcus sp. KSM4-11]
MLTLKGSHDTGRVLTECGGDIQSVKLLYTLLLTTPGTPLIYCGDENGRQGANDPDCRRPMVWQQAQWHAELREHVRQLIALRRAHVELRRGIVHLRHADDRMVVYERCLGDARSLVVVNNTYVPNGISVPWMGEADAPWAGRLSGQGFRVSGGQLELSALAPRSTAVLRPAGARHAG